MLTTGFFSLLLDALIAVLLCATIAYCWILNQRIKVLQDGKSELAQLLKHFDESTKRASESIIALQTASKRIGESIQFRIEKANYLIEDLAYTIEKGEKMASRLDASLAVNRARGRVMAEEPAAKTLMRSTLNPAVKIPAKPSEKPPIERPSELPDVRYHHREERNEADHFPRPETNGDAPARQPVMERPQPSGADATTRQRKLSSLEAMLEKVTARAKLPTMEDDDDDRFNRRNVSAPNWPKATGASVNPPVSETGGTRPAARQRSKAEQELLDMLKSGIKG